MWFHPRSAYFPAGTVIMQLSSFFDFTAAARQLSILSRLTARNVRFLAQSEH
jgi:hypothetical protein